MNKVKKAIIQAGGGGTRLYPVTLETPKPLLTVNKKPIINYLIEMFRKHGVEEVAIVVRKSHFDDYSWWLRRWQNDLGGVWVNPHTTTSLVKKSSARRSKNSFGVGINLMVEGEPMGTLGYWAHNLHTWTGNEPFFMTNGDELKDVDLSAMTEHHYKMGGLATIAAVEVANPKEYGVIVFSSEGGSLPDGRHGASGGDGDYIDKFLEKPENPPSNFISSGLYLLDPKIKNYIKEEIGQDKKFLMIEKDLFPKLAGTKNLSAYKSTGRWFDCGTISRWEDAIKNW